MENELAKLGLSPVEIKVYLTLVKEGSLLAGTISKSSEINRSNCYDALERLIEKGLVSYVIRENRKYFSVSNFENFYTLVQDKKTRLEKQITQEMEIAKNVIINLNNSSSKKPRQRTEVYESSKGIIAILDDMIRTKKEILILGVGKNISDILNFYLPRFHNQRIEKKINLKIVLDEKLRETRGADLKKMKYTQVKFMPTEYSSINTTNIYGDKIALIVWSKEPIGIVIESKEISGSQRKQFDLLWKIARP